MDRLNVTKKFLVLSLVIVMLLSMTGCDSLILSLNTSKAKKCVENFIEESDTDFIAALQKYSLEEITPAGMIDESEKPIEAAIRELREETGYSCEEMIPLEWHYQDVGCSKSVVTTFLAKNAKKLYDLDLDQGERIETILLDEEFIESEMDNMESDNFKDSGSKVAFQYVLKYRK